MISAAVSSASAQSKIITIPQKAEKRPSCPVYAERLDGQFTQTRSLNISGLKQTETSKGRLTWVKDDQDELRPLPNVGGSRNIRGEGIPGSKAWWEFHDKAKCPVQRYRIADGEIEVKVESESRGIGGAGGCKGSGDMKFAADPLKALSNLYVSENGYLLSLGAPDTMLPQGNIVGECTVPGGKRHSWDSPVHNSIMILDRRAAVVYGVNGEIDPAIDVGGGWKMGAKWSFADPKPNR